MKNKVFYKLRNDFIKDTFKLADAKRIEYTEGHFEENVLWNFESVATKLGLTSIQVLSVYLLKHISSLLNYFKDGTTYSEPITERIKDIINYLILLVCMLEQNEIKKQGKKYKGEYK